MSALIWFIAGIALVGAEMFVGELTFLMLGTGALAGAGSALLSDSLWVQLIVFAVVSVSMIFFVKPVLRKKMLSSTSDRGSSLAALAGRSAVVVEPVDEHRGLIRLDGDLWSARAVDPAESYQPDDTVHVLRIDGATAVVWKESS
ncbi:MULTISPECIES: NfeD family protein [Corynebacterium]|uniref:NfeD family protein n=1 Tax=Corynebacterium TaxID=1716 RepID=UPI00124E87A3|nr:MULTISPECIES: NfeD family protein [Corynebacterium]MBV7280901.1 NfeD family protein [Corynebacterium sp. TAE3-ERU30]MBV7302627.1 NfeD family protein [Corynebacterium sp. TAE3-ERU2]